MDSSLFRRVHKRLCRQKTVNASTLPPSIPARPPRIRQGHDMAKIQPVKDLRVEILRQQNTTRPLTGWIGVAAQFEGSST